MHLPRRRARLRSGTIVALFIALAGTVTACGGDDEASDTAARGNSGESVSIGFVSPVATNPNQQDMIFGMEQAAKSLGWEFSMLDANLSPDKQVAHLDTLLTQKKQGVVTWALDPGALAGAFERAAQANVPVVGLNSAGKDVSTDIVWSVFTCGAGSPPAESAAYIAERTPNGKVLVVGPPPVPPLVAETECFIEEAEKAGLEVVGRVDNVKDTAATATPLVADMVTKHPDIAAIWCYNDTSALGSSAALTAAKKTVWSKDEQDGVIVIGSNADADAITAIKEGRMTATWDTNAAATGWAAVKGLSVHLKDGKPISAMPKQIVLDATFWDGENIGDFVPQQERKYTMDNLPIKSEK